jgi:hypothetical protein
MSRTRDDVRFALNFLVTHPGDPCVIDHKGDFLSIYSP